MIFESVKKQTEFDKIFNEGSRASGKLLTIIVRIADGNNKLGIVVGKKYGNAVKRNRVKRLIREAFRQSAGKIRKAAEIVVLPKKASEAAKLPEIASELATLMVKVGV
jgi:ribonuclease P protein component